MRSSHLRKDFFFEDQSAGKRRQRRSFFSRKMRPPPSKEKQKHLFAFFSREYVKNIFRTKKPLFLLGTEGQTFRVKFCVCVCVHIEREQ